MSTPENRTHIPMPEVKKSPEQIRAEAVTAREKEAVDSTVTSAVLATDSAQAREAAMTRHATAMEKAKSLAGSAGDEKTKAGPSVAKKVITYGVAGGIAGVFAGHSVVPKIYEKTLEPLVDWGFDKLKSAWQSLDIWDLSGSKSVKKEKPKKDKKNK